MVSSKSFKFLVMLISLLIVSDIAVMVLSVAFYYEKTEYLNDHALEMSIIIGVGTFFFNMGTNTMHWLFGYKYWIISREVPKLFDDR